MKKNARTYFRAPSEVDLHMCTGNGIGRDFSRQITKCSTRISKWVSETEMASSFLILFPALKVDQA